MDWNSEEGRKLLRAAYPRGGEEVHGLHMTVGGWIRLPSGGWIAAPGAAPSNRDESRGSYRYAQDDGNTVGRNVDSGDLLPLPDPSDVATWACLLVDLLHAARGAVVEGYNHCGLSWIREKRHTDDGRRVYTLWTLTFGSAMLWDVEIDTDDPAEALVRARAGLREQRR